MSSGASVLLIEDDNTDLFLALSALERLGLETVTHVVKDVGDAARYLDAAADTPKVILLGFKVPHMDGFNFLRQLKCGALVRYAHVPVIVFDSDAAQPGVARFCAKLGIFRVLPRPLPRSELVCAIEALEAFDFSQQEASIPTAQTAVSDR